MKSSRRKKKKQAGKQTKKTTRADAMLKKTNKQTNGLEVLAARFSPHTKAKLGCRVLHVKQCDKRTLKVGLLTSPPIVEEEVSYLALAFVSTEWSKFHVSSVGL